MYTVNKKFKRRLMINLSSGRWLYPTNTNNHLPPPGDGVPTKTVKFDKLQAKGGSSGQEHEYVLPK